MSSVAGFFLQLQPPTSHSKFLAVAHNQFPVLVSKLSHSQAALAPHSLFCLILVKHTHDHSFFSQSHYQFPPAFYLLHCPPCKFPCPNLLFPQLRLLAPVSSFSLRIPLQLPVVIQPSHPLAILVPNLPFLKLISFSLFVNNNNQLPGLQTLPKLLQSKLLLLFGISDGWIFLSFCTSLRFFL